MKKIGFISYDDPSSEENQKSLPEAISKSEPQGTSIPISQAQAGLINSINYLANLIKSKEFMTFPQDKRENCVYQLMDFVAVNAELTAKTVLLLA